MLLGTHCSIGGGLGNACEEAKFLGINTIQIFTKNQRQWKEREISEEEGKLFQKKCKDSGIELAFSHAIYLINLAGNDEVRRQSILALAGEVLRCSALGLPYTVLHPGVNKNLSTHEAIERIAEALRIVLEHTREHNVSILLENTAGQGTSIGRRFEDIKALMELVSSERIAMCFDTCHAFAAGYDIRTRDGMDDTLGQIDKLIGLEKLKVFHMNDSKGELGSRIDRHENIGKGKIGLVPFDYIINSFPRHPKVLETPKEGDMDRENLAILKSLYRKE